MKKKNTSIKFELRNKTFFRKIFYKFFSSSSNKMIPISPDLQNRCAHELMNYKYDCTKPKTFNEYLGWLKFNYYNELWCNCADKLGAKEFLSSIGFINYLPKTLFVYENVEEIELSKLPKTFVLKTNNDSGSVFVCDKKTTNFDDVFYKLAAAMRNGYSKGEWVYSKIKPKIFAEEYIGSKKSDKILDYKFFVYSGKYRWGFVAQDRDTDCRFTVFENDFEIQKVDYIYLRPSNKNLPKPPVCFKKMVQIAETIGGYFDFVRVDFYCRNNKPIIGELTFFSQSGLGPFTKKEFDIKYGNFFKNTVFYRMIYGCEKK